MMKRLGYPRRLLLTRYDLPQMPKMSTPKNIDSTQQDVSASLLSFFAQNHCLQANSRAALMARGTVTPLDLSDYDVCSDAGGGDLWEATGKHEQCQARVCFICFSCTEG